MKLFETDITDTAKKNVLNCLESGFISDGDLVDEFEVAIEQKFDYKNCVATNSCTSALHLSLILAGVQKGDEVILPAQTFVATGLPILYCGATPVFADIDPITGNIATNSVVNKRTKKTKAVIGVAWGGNPSNLAVLACFCNDFNLCFIQDNAQALGATHLGFPLDDWGDFSCFSFQAIKHLTTGDGGMLTCANNDDYHIAKQLRWFGIDRKSDVADDTGERYYNLTKIGYKYHMNNISAALGLGNLEGFDERLNRRRMIAHYYTDRFPERILTSWYVGSACWLYTILVDNRRDLMNRLKAKDIPSSVVHVGIDRNDIFGGINKDLINQRYWDDHHLCLPITSSMTDNEVQKVVDTVRVDLK